MEIWSVASSIIAMAMRFLQFQVQRFIILLLFIESYLLDWSFRLGIVTNTFNSRQEKNTWFKTVGIDDIWDSYADSFELQITKPDPKIYLAALEPLNESPENAAFVGHAKIEIDGAKAIGLTTVIFNPDPDCKEADFKIEKFNDLLKIPPVINSI